LSLIYFFLTKSKVVEALFSYETIFTIFGDISHADRIEVIAHNNFPAALDGVMWNQ